MEVILTKQTRKTYGRTIIYYSVNNEEVTLTLYPKYLKKEIKDIEKYPEKIKVSLKV